jgi:hypothetical protein
MFITLPISLRAKSSTQRRFGEDIGKVPDLAGTDCFAKQRNTG